MDMQEEVEVTQEPVEEETPSITETPVEEPVEEEFHLPEPEKPKEEEPQEPQTVNESKETPKIQPKKLKSSESGDGSPRASTNLQGF